MINDNQSYLINNFFNQKLECNKDKSFSNFYQPYNACTNDEFDVDSIINCLKWESTRKNYMNSVYTLLVSFNTYLQQNCPFVNDTKNLKNCLLNARNAAVIKPLLQNATLPIDYRGNKNYQLFNNAVCKTNEKIFSIYNIINKDDSPTQPDYLK